MMIEKKIGNVKGEYLKKEWEFGDSGTNIQTLIYIDESSIEHTTKS
jgi:hypothetical protein